MKITTMKISKPTKFAYVLFFAVIFLVSFGVLMVFSASYYSADLTYGDKMFFAKKQIVGAVIGLASMILFRFINDQLLNKLRWYIFVGGCILLALVFIPHIGVTNYGATRWINLGVTTIQPSEIAKCGFVIFS